ncbi:hypothetical protein WAF17_11750 [Bernardetia sp. ABR2-2B]|uniref:hypothetical protein n=1 Tax=Bernardetia sp. ABR2-2B TaxID=3127472 RepID=UPI0030D540C8
MKKSINYSVSILMLVISVFAFSSCKDEDEKVEPIISCESSVSEVSEANAILAQSSWEWIESRSEGRNGEIVENPETEGKTMSLVFSLGATVEELENGQATGIWEYRINALADTTLGTFSFTWLNAGNIERNYVLDVCPDILTLTDASSSLMKVSTYKKK